MIFIDVDKLILKFLKKYTGLKKVGKKNKKNTLLSFKTDKLKDLRIYLRKVLLFMGKLKIMYKLTELIAILLNSLQNCLLKNMCLMYCQFILFFRNTT